MKLFKWFSVAALATVLAACGGGSGGTDGAEPPPVQKGDGTGTFNPQTRLMTASELDGATLDGTTLTVRKPQANKHAVGNVLVLDGFGGRLIEITAVSESDTEIRYTYTLASLAQAFETLDLHFSGDLTPAELGTDFPTNDPEVEIGWASGTQSGQALPGVTKDVSASTNTLEIKYKRMGAQVGSGVEISGSSSFMLNPDFALSLRKERPGDTLPTLTMAATVNPALNTSISIASLYGGQVSFSLGEKSFPLKPFRRIIIVPIAGIPVPVPFWIKPVIGLSGSVNGTAGSKFSTTYNYGLSGSLGFNRTSAEGLGAVATLNKTSDLNVTDVESEFGVTLGAPKFEIQFLVYSVAGPNFEMGFESGVVGKGATQGTPPVEGVKVDGNIKIKAAVGIKGGVDFKQVDAVKELLGDVSFSYAPVSVTVLDSTLFERSWFFPFAGQASITVYDNGNAPDDIFEVALDGTVVGRTNKGGSGQFRLKNLRPGNHTLSLTTVEDDSPPGTFAISLADGITFSNGSTSYSGTASLGQKVDFGIVVPKTEP